MTDFIDQHTRFMSYATVLKGSQCIIHVEGCQALIVVVNPIGEAKPYFIYRDRDFEDQIQLENDLDGR